MASMEEALARISARAPTYRRPRSGESSGEGAGDETSMPKVSDATTERLLGKVSSGSQGDQSSRRADIAVLAALADPELNKVLSAFGPAWQKESRDGVVYNVARTPISGRDLTVVAAVQNDMGMVPAAILATKTVRAWQPRIVAMVGVCAGVQGRVHLGDIVVARQVFDYGSGKLVDGRLFPDYQPVSIDEHLYQCAIDLTANAAALSSIRGSWPTDTGRPPTELRAHVGAMASGAAVVADDSIVEGIQEHKRSILALDMEAYGMARATLSSISPPLPLVIKAVQDFADESKADDYREYAAFVSVQFLQRFLEDYWDQIREHG